MAYIMIEMLPMYASTNEIEDETNDHHKSTQIANSSKRPAWKTKEKLCTVAEKSKKISDQNILKLKIHEIK